jgi:hypothetical protein
VLFEWHSADHVDPSESYVPLPEDTSAAWDYFHINSIDRDGSARLLVSARNTHAVHPIRTSDGEVLRRLGGKKTDFRLGPGARFAWQHDARTDVVLVAAFGRAYRCLVSIRETASREEAEDTQILGPCPGSPLDRPPVPLCRGWGADR